METKIQKLLKTDILGFPVIIHDVTLVKRVGQWCPEINWNVLAKIALMALMTKHSKLTGGEIKFIRTHLNLTYRKFGEIIGVAASTIKKWEGEDSLA